MKKFLVSLFCLLYLLGTIPAAVAQGTTVTANDSTPITANAQRDGAFHYPQKVEFPYLTADVAIGKIGLTDLFLHENEELLITFECVPLASPEEQSPQACIPFRATVEALPASVTQDGFWEVMVAISEQDWKSAVQGEYTGCIVWTITSSLTGEILFQEETSLHTVVPPPKDDSGDSEPPQTGDNTSVMLYSLLAGLSGLLLLVLLYINGRRITQDGLAARKNKR